MVGAQRRSESSALMKHRDLGVCVDLPLESTYRKETVSTHLQAHADLRDLKYFLFLVWFAHS